MSLTSDPTHPRALALRSAYARAVDRLVLLAQGLDPEGTATPVPATPGWSAHDLLAHLAGAATDLVSGRMDGAPGPAWTARHVGEGSSQTTAALAEQLADAAATIPDDVYGSASPTPVWDLIVHEADLLEALGRPRQPEDAWRALLAHTVRHLGAVRGAEGVLVTTENRWALGPAGAHVRLDADDYELARVVYSRRSRRQVGALTDAPGPLESLQVFGLRDDDLPA